MKWLLRLLAGLALYFLSVFQTYAQSDTEFWFAAPDLQQNHGDRPILLRMAAANVSATVTISIPANPAFTPLVYTIPANSSISADLTGYISQIENAAINTVLDKGLHITSTARITCYYDIAHTNNGDMYALKGRNALGTKFTVPFQMSLLNRVQLGFTYTTDFIIVATENGTDVQINTRTNLTGQALKTFTIKLNRGETYVCSINTQVPTEKPGGTIVTSNKPIAISTKDDSILYPNQGCSDTAGDQLIPDSMAGTEFILTKGYFSQTVNTIISYLPDFYYIFAIEDNTQITIDGVFAKNLLKAGDYYKASLSDVNDYVVADKPVHIFQISGFGCEIGGAVIPSVKCTGSTWVNVTRASTEEFYANVLAPASIINDFKLNGSNFLIDASQFQVVPGTSNKWYSARISVPLSVAGMGSSVIIENPLGKFHVGVIHGGKSTTTRFGYFSDFSINSVLLTNPSKPGVFLKEKDTVCYKSNLTINALVSEANSYTWSGPNNHNSVNAGLNITNFSILDTGTYKIIATTIGCGTAMDSIRLQMDRPYADFNFTTNGCEGDSVKFTANTPGGTRWVWNFDNGKILDTNSVNIPKIKLNAARDFNVAMRVASKLGCFSDDSLKTVKLSSIPKPAYKPAKVTCINKDISFDDVSTILVGSIVKWRWDLADGNGFTEYISNSSQTSKYASSGHKDVKLVVESQTGCISDTFNLASFVVNPNPIPGFILPEVCLNDASARFMDTTSSPDGYKIFTYQWFFNAGTPAITPGPDVTTANLTEMNPAVHYNKADHYQVKLIVDSRGCIDSLTKEFTVNGANPEPLFDIVQKSPLCSNDSIRITNNSKVDFGEVTRLEIFWDPTDLTKKTTDEFPAKGKGYAYLYPAFQTPSSLPMTIALKAYSGNASTCSKSVSNIAVLLPSPKLTFNTLPGICLEAVPRQITEASFDTNVPGNYSFNGLGVSASGVFDPKLVGVDTVKLGYLYVSDKGCRDSAYQDQIVWPRPLADFVYSAITCEKNPIRFTSQSSALVGSLQKMNWNFDDGSPLQVVNDELPYAHSFTTSKTYQVSLDVVTSNGCTSLPKIIPVQVNPLPLLSFDLPNVCLPEGKALFKNHTDIPDGTGAQLSYLWDFGDLKNTATDNSKDGLHYFSQLGSYQVKLLATSNHQCKDSLTQQLTEVFPQPKAGFQSLDSVCLGTDIQFTDKSDGLVKPIVAWHWNFTDGGNSNINNPLYLFRNPGNYKASLYITTSVGCNSDTAFKTIDIFPYPSISAGPDLYALEDGMTKIPATATLNALLFNWSPASYLDQSNILQPTIVRPQNDLVYTLTVIGRGACVSKDNVKMTVLRKPTIPNTFTPNGDGINDVWEISNLSQYPECVMEIYTPQGQMIFKSNGYTKPWDGTYRGNPLPAGTYYYVIDPRSGRKKMAGYVTIFK